MQLPDWAIRHPLGLSLGACVLLGVAGGWLSTPLPDSTGTRNAANAWQLPNQRQLSRFDERTFMALQLSHAWASSQEASARGPGPRGSTQRPLWSLLGVVLSPEPVALILDTHKAQVSRVSVGATLPDGAKLVTISHDSISVSAEGCSTHINVFRTRDETNKQTCDGDTQGARPDHAGNPDD